MPSVGAVVARNSLASLTGQVALKGLSFLFTIAVVRQLGEHNFGLYATVAAFGAICAIFSDLGISSYAVREIAAHPARAAATLADMLAVRCLLSVLVLMGSTALAVALGYDAALVALIAFSNISLFLYAFQGPIQVTLEGYERYDYTTLASVVHQAVFITTGAAFLWFGWGVAGVIAASFCGIAAAAALSWRALRSLAPLALRTDPRRWLPLVKCGIPFGITTFATLVSFRIDTILLSLWRTPSEVGWYSIAYNLIFSLLALLLSFNTVLVPSLSRQYTTEPALVHAFYARALRALWVIALPIAVGTTLLADRIILLLYGPSYAPAGVALRLLIWVLPLLAITSLCGSAATVLRREQPMARLNFVNAGFNIALNLWAITNYGLLGAAIVTVATELVGLSQFLFLLRDALPLQTVLAVACGPLLAVVAMAAAVLMLWWLPLLLLIPLAAAVYAVLLPLSGGVSLEEVRGVLSVVIKRRASVRWPG